MHSMLFDNNIEYDADDFALYTTSYIADGVLKKPTISITNTVISVSEFSCIVSGRVADLEASEFLKPEVDGDGYYMSCVVYVEEEDENVEVKLYVNRKIFSSATIARQGAQIGFDALDVQKGYPLAIILVGDSDSIEWIGKVAETQYEQHGSTEEIQNTLQNINARLYRKAQADIETVKALNFPSVEVVSLENTIYKLSATMWASDFTVPAGYEVLAKGLIFLNGRLKSVDNINIVPDGTTSHIWIQKKPYFSSDKDIILKVYCTKTSTKQTRQA